ncbi:hypothetical protein U9M73_07465 [Paenibacillus phoenicis]|uniref:Multi-TM2 domain-containing protein n=1 Tax=Paenibacillus phoenicis TaxID=554117 RepID=A0ABU5PIR8_9BACL|nr:MULTISPECIES: membrane protein [Paenibacillus]EES72089.1 hypothetical protein POTG_03183 [Paenibacillus sp. oral taxon 786 str. D14]MCT2195507.1 hypothetical protein [Paenibacillus sp. p3-SID1389]MEA3569835.1 hypothetical protein [Paenibacillus phoenicis]
MPYERNRLLALLLNFIPGVGHLYWGKKGRGITYPILFFGGIFFGFAVSIAAHSDDLAILTLIAAAILWLFSMFDLLIIMLRETPEERAYREHVRQMTGEGRESEKFFTILLSFVPGLGHFQLGLMQRGLSFLIAFFGLITMMFFVTGITHESVFLLFLGLLPIIWLYSMFDAVQLVHRKLAGEPLVDRTPFDDWEAGRIEGRRSKVLATMLSAFPGAGQMYLGLQKRGLQMMALFLGSFYVIDVLRLSVFLFIIPIIWFYCFFDGLQQTSRYGILPMEDRPLMETRGEYQHWLGIALILLGIYFVGMELIVPILDTHFPELHIYSRIEKYLRPTIVAVLLIGGGIKLLARPKRRNMLWSDEEI